jgi:hypothetical protein
MKGRIGAVETALIGDEFHPGEGLVHQTKELKKEVSELKKIVLRAQYFVSGIIFITGVVMTILNIIF